MRLNLQTWLSLGLIFLAPVAVWMDLSFILVCLLLLAGFVLKRYLTFSEFRNPADTPLILESISASHYVEKVRWCLDRAKIPYQEQPDIGILGVLLKGRMVPTLHIPGSGRLSNSSQILRFLWGSAQDRNAVAFLAPSKEATDLEVKFDLYGEHLRRWGYHHILQDPEASKTFWGAHDQKIPGWQRHALPLLFPLLRAALMPILQINDRSAARSLAKVHEVFDEVDALLADGRAYLLGGDAPSYIDLTWAALSGVLLAPEQYGNGTIDSVRPKLELFPQMVREEVEHLRTRPAGVFAMKIYEEERHR